MTCIALFSICVALALELLYSLGYLPGNEKCLHSCFIFLNRSHNHSRPGSRQGDISHHYQQPAMPHQNSSFYGQTGYYPPNYPYAPQQQMAPPSLPDPKTLEMFKKNWEYYSRNPQEMENLRVNKPTTHANLLR